MSEKESDTGHKPGDNEDQPVRFVFDISESLRLRDHENLMDRIKHLREFRNLVIPLDVLDLIDRLYDGDLLAAGELNILKWTVDFIERSLWTQAVQNSVVYFFFLSFFFGNSLKLCMGQIVCNVKVFLTMFLPDSRRIR